MLKVSAELDARRTRQVLDCFDFHDEEFAGANVFYGMRQMTEIAVKAISPSINDPGTAIRVLNLHGVLLGRLVASRRWTWAASTMASPGCSIHS